MAWGNLSHLHIQRNHIVDTLLSETDVDKGFRSLFAILRTVKREFLRLQTNVLKEINGMWPSLVTRKLFWLGLISSCIYTK